MHEVALNFVVPSAANLFHNSNLWTNRPAVFSTAPCKRRKHFTAICLSKSSGPPEPFVEPEQNNHEDPTPENNLTNLANRFVAAREQYAHRSNQLDSVQQPSDSTVLGSELSTPLLSSTTIIQDLPVPPAPLYFGYSPRTALSYIHDFLDLNNTPRHEREFIDSQLVKILATLRASTFDVVDDALEIFPASYETETPTDKLAKSLDALTALLHSARFVILPDLPQVGEPPCPDAVPLGSSLEINTDSTLLMQSPAIRKYVISNNISLGSPSVYPYLFVATRGVSISRKSGILLQQKIRALERACFGLIRTPFSPLIYLYQSLQTFLMPSKGQESKSIQEESEPKDNDTEDDSFIIQKVRRVVPAVQLDRGWDQLREQFMPTVTQEPCHEQTFLLFREVVPDKKSIRQKKRAALLQQLQESIMQAVNPLPPSKRKNEDMREGSNRSKSMDSFERSPGTLSNMTMQLFSNVPWGTIQHIFPSTYVLPATRDLLRVDALTFTGLLSALISFVRHPDSSFVAPYLTFSAISYSIRVALGWRNAVISYNSVISRDKLTSLSCQGRSSVESIAALAVEEGFADVACVWLARKGHIDDTNARDIQKLIFGKCCLGDEDVRKWRAWLDEHGFGGGEA